MADWTQSAVQTLLTPAAKTNATDYYYAGSAVDVRTMDRGTIWIYHSYIEAIANDPAVTYEIQLNHDTGDSPEFWATIVELGAQTGAVDTNALDDTAASGQAVVPLAATTNFAMGDIVYIRGDSVPGEGEWNAIASISAGVSITLRNNLTNSYASGDDVYNDANRWVVNVELAGASFLRVLCTNGDATGADWACAAYGLFATDYE